MSHSVDALLKKLSSDVPTERLEAARYFADHAGTAHEQAIRDAYARETVRWIRAALARAIARTSPDQIVDVASENEAEDLPQEFVAQVYADALQTTSSQLMHEIEPIVGALRLAATTEVPDFEASELKKHLDHLDALLSALSRLRKAAGTPVVEEFDLTALLESCIEKCADLANIKILKAGPDHLIVIGDKNLITLTILNGLRNAIEATALVVNGGTPITLNWGMTDVDHWVSIIDQGIGFKGNILKAFEIGSTTKAGHLGMGLAIAQQALASQGGRVLLVPNQKGVRFEMRWPRPKAQ